PPRLRLVAPPPLGFAPRLEARELLAPLLAVSPLGAVVAEAVGVLAVGRQAGEERAEHLAAGARDGVEGALHEVAAGLLHAHHEQRAVAARREHAGVGVG